MLHAAVRSATNRSMLVAPVKKILWLSFFVPPCMSMMCCAQRVGGYLVVPADQLHPREARRNSAVESDTATL